MILPEDRLDILREVDVERKWYSLDDKRICVVCDHVITGRQVEIIREPGGTYSLKCPTPGCPSDFRHWLLSELSPARYQTYRPRSRYAA